MQLSVKSKLKEIVILVIFEIKNFVAFIKLQCTFS